MATRLHATRVLPRKHAAALFWRPAVDALRSSDLAYSPRAWLALVRCWASLRFGRE